MDWEPLEIDHFHFEGEDEKTGPDLCLNCYGRGQPKFPLAEIRVPTKDTLQKYAEKSTKAKRGRGRAQVLRERALHRVVGVREDTVSQESASLMDSASDLASSPSNFNQAMAGCPPSSNTKFGFMDNWFNSLEGQDVTFFEPIAQSQLPKGFGPPKKKGPKRTVDEYLKDMNNITMVSRGRRSGSKSNRNDSSDVTPATSTVNDSVTKSFKNDSLNVSPASSVVNESSLEEAIVTLSEEGNKHIEDKGTLENIASPDDKCDGVQEMDNLKVTTANADKDNEQVGLEIINMPKIEEYKGEDSQLDISKGKLLVANSKEDHIDLIDNAERKCIHPYDKAEESIDPLDTTVEKCMDTTVDYVKENGILNADHEHDENGAKEENQNAEEEESVPLILENLPENCSLTTLLDIAGSYGEIKECNFDDSQHSAVILYYKQEACIFARDNLDGEDGFFEEKGTQSLSEPKIEMVEVSAPSQYGEPLKAYLSPDTE